MVVVVSRLIAVVLTLILACLLYPVAAFFYIIGWFGKIGDVLFQWTNKMVKRLWEDLKNENENIN